MGSEFERELQDVIESQIEQDRMALQTIRNNWLSVFGLLEEYQPTRRGRKPAFRGSCDYVSWRELWGDILRAKKTFTRCRCDLPVDQAHIRRQARSLCFLLDVFLVRVDPPPRTHLHHDVTMELVRLLDQTLNRELPESGRSMKEMLAW
ncbi:hypothetical protein ACFYPT_35850 [Streptomyces sp. NPDC005529]|uniref:hypothetical protein n=1 Tax=unclassified Streptomyces TaxID=2593676 RepID=UPI0033A52EF1